MPKFDAKSAEVLLFSYKDGLLAKVAHDLKMRVDEFSIDGKHPEVLGILPDLSKRRSPSIPGRGQRMLPPGGYVCPLPGMLATHDLR